MSITRGTLWFAPGHRMSDVDLDDPIALVEAFGLRVEGFFLAPARYLATMAQPESSLFASALICAASIELLARVDPNLRKSARPIADWLNANVPQFRQRIKGKSAAAYFEERFRNGLVHEGYIAGLGRLGDPDEIVSIDGDVVTVNPSLLIDEIAKWWSQFADDLSHGRRNAAAFQYRMKELFQEEVKMARQERAGP